ncbi:MFS transporter [uncultured Brachybacterium sp.]|uniref:MFS transporter n=1 Tax=uncultured Brachybacterium sp. TaxID=189680 RepID=UPI002633B179|nr:MFS transporter [uncultured Brachybacterium sp.]
MSRSAIGMIVVAAAAAFLATFNETFLNVALTPIMESFSVDIATVQWLATGYLLVAAMFVPVSNVLYQRFATRPLFVAVVALMVIGSVIGALAPSFGVLLAGRLLQAIGTGLLTPIGMNITLAVAPREKLGMAMGIMAAMTTLGPSLAIVVSGALLSFTSWTTLMWIFGALALVVLLAGAVLLRTVVPLGRPVLDVLSFLLVAVGLVGLLYGISTAFSGSPLVAAITAVVGIAALAAFIRRQSRIENPLLNLQPFRSTPFVLGVAMTMLGLLFVFAMNVVIPIFLQSVRGLSPLGASLLLAPGILLTVALGPIAGRLFDRRGGRVMIPVGFAIMAVFALLVGVAAGSSSVLLFGLLYIPAVLATSLVIGPSQTFALSHLDRETSPHGVTVVSTSFQIAGCLGTSLAVGVFNATTSLSLTGGSDALAASTTGFRGAAVLVALASALGIVLAVASTRASRTARAAQTATVEESAASGATRTVEGLMKSDVHALSTEQSVLEALRMFSERGISGAPVLDADGSLAGFLSDGDVMRYLSAEHPSSASIYSFAIGESADLEDALADLVNLSVMRLATREVVTVDASASIADAVAVLSDEHLKKVPVVRGEGGPMIGIVSRSAINRLAISSSLASRGESAGDTAEQHGAAGDVRQESALV